MDDNMELLSRFSDWTPWAERARLPTKRRGLYMLASFNDVPLPVRPSLSYKLIYIGETCGQSLHSRLYQFNRSGFLGKFGHSGGATFAKTSQAEQNPEWLFVATAEVLLDEPQASAYIRYAERALLWQYVQQHGEYPSCNKK
jgi:hypothetical protein